MTTYQIKQMICEQIIEACEDIIYDTETISFWQKNENSDNVTRNKMVLNFHKGQRDALRDLYKMIQKKEEEENVQQLSIPDQADDSVKSLD